VNSVIPTPYRARILLRPAAGGLQNPGGDEQETDSGGSGKARP